jgi:hypothetical protein
MTDEELRIRSYLGAQAAKLTPALIVEKVRAAMAELRAAAIAVPAPRFAERPTPEEWSGNEVMAHVLAADAYFSSGILSALDGGPPPQRPAGRGIEGAPLRPASVWCDELDRARAALFARALAADPDAHLDRAIEHGTFGPLTWRETLLFHRLHDLDHAGQLRKIAAAFA